MIAFRNLSGFVVLWSVAAFGGATNALAAAVAPTFASIQHVRLVPAEMSLPDLDADDVHAAHVAAADTAPTEMVADAHAAEIEPLAVSAAPTTSFSLSPGGRVSEQLGEFATRQNWQLAWEIDRDFPIEYPATFSGDFFSIVEQIVVSLQNTDAPIRVKVYEANRVLRIVHATQ